MSRPVPEEWCCVEVVVHLSDMGPRYHVRLKRSGGDAGHLAPLYA